MYNFESNDLIEAVLYDRHKISSYIKYCKLLRKIKRISPDYTTLETIYKFIDQLNYAYFYCLDKENKLFIKESRKNSKKYTNNKSLVYKDDSVTITLSLLPDEKINLYIQRLMGYQATNIEFENGQVVANNKLEEQLFINCTNLIMDELYFMVKKYRYFRKVNKNARKN